MYYNTNKETGEVLQTSKSKSISQEAVILNLFSEYYESATAEDIHRHFSSHTPLTSIRRAITNLCNDGSVYKTDAFDIGKYGKRIHYYAKRAKGAIQLNFL